MAVRVPESFLAWLPRVLLLLAIWGTAVFLWGTFGAWTYNQYTASERRYAQAHVQATSEWLKELVRPLEPLANDSRIAQGMELPAGVESLPIQRVLYEFGYLTRQSEVYAVDLLRKRVGKTAGSAPLPEEALNRLAELPDSERLIFGMGGRNGQMLLARKVKAPLPERLMVMVPMSLGTLASQYPAPRLPEKRTLGVVVPHTTGWAEWRDGGQGFVLDELLNKAVEGRQDRFESEPWIRMLVPVPEWDGIMLGLQSPDEVSGGRLLPQLLVGLWAIVMSLMVLWSVGKELREKLLAKLQPVMAPLEKVITPLGGMIHSMSDAIAAKWNAENREVPLVEGPGGFGRDDFSSAAELMARAKTNRPPKRAAKLTSLNQNVPEVGPKTFTGDRERRKLTQPKMAWPEGMERRASMKKDAPRLPPVDSSNLLEVVRDCLRKKRVKLLYQPIYRAGDNMPVMHEVYARLVKVNGEIISPGDFMPIVMKHKLALELDLVVLRKVVNEHFTGGNSPLTSLALNISSTSLDGIAYLQEMTAQGPRVLQKISFEVRSQEMIRDPKALRLLKDLQKHGGNLAVDYFGGGTAMLDASKAMGFNYVKLNCSKFMETDEGKKDMIMMCRHAQKEGLPIILEMIGDPDTLVFARKTGAEFLQGYELARPEEFLTTVPLPPPLG